jgi:malonate transporter
MAGVLIGFGIIAFVIAVGYVAGRFGLGGSSASYALNRIAFFVTSPALLFTVLARADLHDVFSATPLIEGLATLVSGALFVSASRMFFRRPVPETVIGTLGASYVNANNIGLPVSVYVLGSATYVAPVLLLQLIVFAPIALGVLDVSTRGRVSMRDILLQPVRNPMILASVAGLLVDVAGWHIPDAVLQPFELLGGAAVPLVLLAYGMSLHGARPLRSAVDRVPILVASCGKAVVMPLVAWAVASLLGLHGHALFAAVALGALPTAQNVFNFASRYQRGETIARDTVLVTTVAAIPVLLVVAALFA